MMLFRLGGCRSVVLLLVLLSLKASPSAGQGLFDNLLSQLMTTATSAQNFLGDAYDQRQGRGTEPPTVAAAGAGAAVTSNGIGGGASQPSESTTQQTVQPFAEGPTTHGTRAPPTHLPFWNPFVWLRPKEPAIPYNPDTDLSTPEIAVRHGYAAESHTLKTADGYLLTVHRLPCGRAGCTAQGGKGAGQPVFLQHGLLSSSADWLLSGPDRALAFILADAGYDVWLGNARGNTYSRKHVSLSSDETAFWDFSWHEMAMYDIPAEIDYLYTIREQERNDTRRNLLYIGHSMGTTMAFALLASRPEYNEKLEAVFALAPIAFMGHVKSPIRLLAPFSHDIEIPLNYFDNLRVPNWVDGLANDILKRLSLRLLMILKFFGGNEFMPQNKIIRYLAKYGCELTEAEKYICENTVFVLCGFDKEQYNATLMPVIFGHTPAGTSTKTVVHYAQEIHNEGSFQLFDYGEHENQRRYGRVTPPVYDLDNISTPIALFYANNDWLAGPLDVANLFNRLHRTSIGMFKIPNDNFNHVDFLWGNDAPEVVYKQLLMLMQRYR